MPRTTWSDTAVFEPKITPRDAEPDVIEITERTHAHEIESRMADALSIGREAIVIGRKGAARVMICKARHTRQGVMLITKDARGSGVRHHVRAALADALRTVAAEFTADD